MFFHAGILLLSFFLILAASEAFTNGVEWAGRRLEIAESAVGSLLAAVGTALPETLIPAVALVSGRGRSLSHSAVGVGAIVGAPLMLSTVALMVMGTAAMAFRQRHNLVVVSRDAARRDLRFFLLNFSVLAALGLFQPSLNLRRLFAILLLGIYGFYAYVVLRLERSEETVIEHRLYLETLLGGDSAEPRAAITALQVVLAVGMILAGASLFVEQVILLSRHLGVDPGVVSLILSPLATELPEKYNSVVWIRQSKDHLALANITGAMVFQACIPGALGLAFTPWHLTPAQWVACAVAVVSAAILYLNVRRGYLKTPAMMFGGVAYLVFIGGLWMVGAI